MLKVEINYNPYKVNTDVILNGESISDTRSPLLYIAHKRLQEWIEPMDDWKGFFHTLRESTGESSARIDFIGTVDDYDDLVYAKEKYGACFDEIILSHKNKESAKDADPYKKMEKLRELYKKLQEGPVDELKTEDICRIFENAIDSDFKIVMVINSGMTAVEITADEHIRKYALTIKLKSAHDAFMEIVDEAGILAKYKEKFNASAKSIEELQIEILKESAQCENDKTYISKFFEIQKGMDEIYNDASTDEMERIEIFCLKEIMSRQYIILAVSKILLGSRAFTKKTMKSLLEKLVGSCVPEMNKQVVYDVIANEEYHYIPPQHNSEFLDKMWRLAQAIDETRIVEIKYKRLKDKAVKNRRIQPLAILFSEMYFYLCGFIEDIDREQAFDNASDPFPTIYRIDRIQSLTVTEDRFKIPYHNRFEEGEFRKRIQFMQGGKLRKIKFVYSGLSIESVLDRFPTAKILSEDDGKYTIQAEVFGDGVDMWLRGQGDIVKVLK